MSLKYKNVTYDGSTCPDDVYRNNLNVHLTKHIISTYIPALNKVLPNGPRGLKLFLTVMANTEGFYPGSRSYDNNNPGNIGNTDTGANKKFTTLEEGIKHQVQHIQEIANGKKKYYPIGKQVYLRPFHSKEIENNKKNYAATSGYVPGYRFIYTGQLDQFSKIYSTLPRIHNSYINTIISYFAKNGLTISPTNTIKQIIEMQ